MGQRGPKPELVKRMDPAERARLDQAIIDGRETQETLHARFGKPHGVSYSAFSKYASRVEARARHQYTSELLVNVFGNLADADIDARARGILVAAMDRVASTVLSERDLGPRDLRDITRTLDMIRRGTIAQAQETRRQTEWDVMRMAGTVEAAAWMKDTLAVELRGDPELCQRLQTAVDAHCAGMDKPAQDSITASLLNQVAGERNWSKDLKEVCALVYGIDPDAGGPPTTKQLPERARQEMRDIYGL